MPGKTPPHRLACAGWCTFLFVECIKLASLPLWRLAKATTDSMNTHSVSTHNALGNSSETVNKTLTLTAVVLVHIAGLVWAAQHLSITEPVVTPPSVVGVLVAPEPAPAAPKQVVQAPPPKPETRPTPPKPVSKPAPTPVPKQEAVREPVAEPTPQAAASAPSAASTAPATPASSSTAPAQNNAPAQEATQAVTPPRTDAAHLNNPAPQYPALSRRLGEQGRVMVDVYILPDGSVGEIKLNRSSGFPRLDAAALQAVKNWKFVPAKRGDKPIAFWYVQPVSFVLNN